MLLVGTCFVVAIDTVSADQDGDYTYTVSNGEATITGYTGAADGAVTIPSTLGGYPTVYIGTDAFYFSNRLTSVTIPEGVTTIGDYAFCYCYQASFTIPHSVTTIGRYAFCDCRYLTSVTIPNIITIDVMAFANCDRLNSVTIGKNLTNIGIYAFVRCPHLTTIDVNKDNMKYTSVDGILYNKAITTVIECPGGKIGTINIPGSVIIIADAAFTCCPSLTSVTIPNSVTTIGDLGFERCSALASVTIPDSVTTIGWAAFGECPSLRSVTIGNSVTTIGYWAFRSTSLTSITFRGLVAPTTVGTDWILSTPVEIRGHAFADSDFPPPGGDFYGLTIGAYIDPIDQQQIQYNKNIAFYSTRWHAQSFIPTTTTLTRAEVYISKALNPTSDLVLSIRSSITGADLVIISKPASEILTSNGWVVFNFADLDVIPGSTYYLVLKTGDGNNKNYYNWGYGTNTPYVNGMRWGSNNGGKTWTQYDTQYDFCFKIYGFT